MMIWRHYALVVFIVLASLGLVARLAYLNVWRGADMVEESDSRSVRLEKIPAYRGVIYDRFGEPLAVSTPVAALWTDPKRGGLNAAGIALLEERLAIDGHRIEMRLQENAGRRFMYLERGLDWDDAMSLRQALKQASLDGVGFQTEYRRFYPAGEITAHVVGLTNVDDKGIEGLELSFDDLLGGTPGKKEVLRDARGHTVKDLRYLGEPDYGSDLFLSLDLRLQFLAYRELKAAVESHRASSGSMVMLDAVTGEILALVNQPSYNPNEPVGPGTQGMRNRAVTDTYEPGSTIKPFAALAALVSGKSQPDTIIDTTPGYFRIGRKLVQDPVSYGTISLETVLKKSSQVGIAKVALALPERAVFDVLSQVGIGDYLGTGLPGEVGGTLTDRDLDKPVVRAVLAYGYGLAVSPLQLAQAYLTLATGGLRLPISILRLETAPQAERVFEQSHALQVVSMMEGVTDAGGTAPLARIDGYRVAGKTGTVRKVGRDGYDDERHAAWFAGIAPASNPRIVAVIIINEPGGEAKGGGGVAAPVFGRVMARALHLLGVPPDSALVNEQGQGPGQLPREAA